MGIGESFVSSNTIEESRSGAWDVQKQRVLLAELDRQEQEQEFWVLSKWHVVQRL